MNPEEIAYKLFESVLKQRQEALDELAEQMYKEGKFPHEYVIVDNWDDIIEGLDQNKLAVYRCQALPKLVLPTYMIDEEV